ncbi:Lrp/AsnC family transcriptional regulator [Nonomuraea sp. SBT364]|uniref:Lrp/AsnC family transcriptional regulator n=1 Tax=Nonomuraea sp. SBT364 TaxID=1580530 RepID=UPI00066AEEBC|nr:Lrp/AsnC family transcriptional regulator [Nonomuraea sp. SBT364]
MTESLDATDWAILTELQKDGRIPLTELGRRVSLSSSAATERVRRLEAAGVITGYQATVDLEKVGLPVLAVIRMKYHDRRHEPFRRFVHERPEIVECLRITGEDCYLLKVSTASMARLETLVDEICAYGSTTTSLVYSQPLPYRGATRPEPPA